MNVRMTVRTHNGRIIRPSLPLLNPKFKIELRNTFSPTCVLRIVDRIPLKARLTMKFYSVFAFFALLAPAQTTTTPVVTVRAAARFLDQATWGPTPASIAQVQSIGFTAWLQAQYALNTSDLPDQPILNAAGANRITTRARCRPRFFFRTPSPIRDQLSPANGLHPEPESGSFRNNPESHPPYAYPPYWRLFRDNAFARL